MRFKTIEKIKFRLAGRSVPAVKVADIGANGQIHTLQLLGEVKDRPNSLVETYNVKGWEKDKKASMVTFIDTNGVKTMAHIVSPYGKTVNIYTNPSPPNAPNWEDAIGMGAMADDIADNMDLGKSARNIVIGIIIGMALYAGLLGPMLGAMLQ